MQLRKAIVLALLTSFLALLMAGCPAPLPPVTKLMITTESPLPDAIQGEHYSKALQVTGGDYPFVWSTTELPPGLTLNPETGELSGTPTNTGKFSFKVAVTNSAKRPKSDTRNFQIDVVLRGRPFINLGPVLQASNDIGLVLGESLSMKLYGISGYPSPGESLVDRVLGQLRLGNIAFNAPSTMEVEEAQSVQLVLSLEQSIGELKSSIQALGEKEGARVSVSDRMQASLFGSAFGIVAVTSEEQAITSRGITSWQWEVVPRKEGSHRLYLSLTALFEVNGKDTKRSVKTFERIIEVEVTPLRRARLFVSDNWQWLCATIVIPLGLWLSKILR
jgi:Putative Ig domain